MIIIQTAKKDTFVTDMSTQFNKGIESNFGQASTLDLFKIVYWRIYDIKTIP